MVWEVQAESCEIYWSAQARLLVALVGLVGQSCQEASNQPTLGCHPQQGLPPLQISHEFLDVLLDKTCCVVAEVVEEKLQES